MSKNYLLGSYELEYAGLALHARYEGSQDEINQRLAGHEFIKVDGAYQEPMGSGADSYRLSLVFVGATWRADLAAAIAHFKRNPKGLLVHPVHGQKRVGWKTISPAVSIPEAVNAATATVQFVEDNLDPAAGQPSTAAAASATVTDQGDVLTSLVADYDTSTVSQVASYVGLATTYAALALAVVQDGTPDPSLPAALAAVQTSAVDTLDALDSDSTASSSTLATARTAAIQVYAAALTLDAIANKQQPAVEEITLAGAVSLARLCSDRYGKDAGTTRDLVLAMNRIPTPALMPAGTRLFLPVATV